MQLIHFIYNTSGIKNSTSTLVNPFCVTQLTELLVGTGLGFGRRQLQPLRRLSS